MLSVSHLALFGTVRTWRQAVSVALDTDLNYGGSLAVRTLIPSASLTSRVDGLKVRLTFQAPSASSMSFTDCYIGHAGTAPNFDGNQVRVTFAGANGLTLASGAGDYVSDAVFFAYDATKDLIISMAGAATNNNRGKAQWTTYFKSGDGANVGSTTVSGYTTNANQYVGVKLIEVFAR